MFPRPSLWGSAYKLWQQSRITRRYHKSTGDTITPSHLRGIDHLRNPRLNKDLAFTLEERQTLGIHGLQPARIKTQEEQLELCRLSVNRYKESIDKYTYLGDLFDCNERLFYQLITENLEDLLPIVYTPTVGLACQRYGLIYRRPHGIFVNYTDRGHVFEVLKNWHEADVRAICVTDGERILGLGDLGANGMGIPVGKLALYTATAGIPPHQCLPVMLDVGTNNPNLLEDPLYVGLRQPRVSGQDYDDFIDEFMAAVVKRYGQNTLIQFEDFASHNALRLLDKYRNKYCTFNDDIQGTAAVIVGGFYASKRITGKAFKDYTFLFAGAGGASTGIANLTVQAMVKDGLPIEEAYNNIYMTDMDGLLTKSRNLDAHPAVKYAKDMPPMNDLAEIVAAVKPSVLIGASATGGLFTPEILRAMADINERPVIFALSNPTDKAECTAEDAYKHTDARVIFSSGSPFPPVTMGGKTYTPGQGNNAFIFPGVALSVISARVRHIPDEMFLIAANEVAKSVEPADLERGSVFPPVTKIRDVSLEMAASLCEYAYDRGMASTYPEPSDKLTWLKSSLYNYIYESSMPLTYAWPELPDIKTKKLSDLEYFKKK